MVLDPSITKGFTLDEQKFLSIVKKFGWHVMKVVPNEGQDGNFWAYSTGLYYSFQHPELLIFNQKLDVMQGIINDIGSKVQSGETFESGKTYAGILENYDCAFRTVSPAYYEAHVGYSRWFYEGDSFPLLQCFWPDKNNHFPWEPECDAGVRDRQPLLYLPL
jgi:hypothetical protein